jgi:hypothetical protein
MLAKWSALYALPALALLTLGSAPRSVDIPWRADWESARREARLTGRPLFVVFRCER